MTIQSGLGVRASGPGGPAVSSTTTATEQAFAADFSAVGGSLSGSGWVSRLRREAIDAFRHVGLPSRRNEAFKYTDLKTRLSRPGTPALGSKTALAGTAIDAALGPLGHLEAHRLVLVDGIFRPELSSLGALNGFAEAMPLAPLLGKAPGWLEGKFTRERLGEPDAVALLNTAFMSDGLLIKIKPGQTADRPLLLVAVSTEAEPRSTALRHIVAMEPGSRLTLIEAQVALPGAGRGLVNTFTDVTVAAGASLDHVAWAAPNASASHLTSTIVAADADAVYRSFRLSSDVGLARHATNVRLNGSGAMLDISGAFLARGSEHIDTTLVVDHAAPGSESRELFKGVLDGRARGVFQGRIIVRPGADKTDGKQMAKALMLSEDAEFDAKPELEIFADDVACGHGATCAELDPQLVFYCRSRGIPEAEARALLIEAFIGEAIDKVRDEHVREALLDSARAWLRQEAASTAANAS